MKKKTVITTEKREVWIVREGIPDTHENQPMDVSNAIETTLPDNAFRESNEPDDEEKN